MNALQHSSDLSTPANIKISTPKEANLAANKGPQTLGAMALQNLHEMIRNLSSYIKVRRTSSRFGVG